MYLRDVITGEVVDLGHINFSKNPEDYEEIARNHQDEVLTEQLKKALYFHGVIEDCGTDAEYEEAERLLSEMHTSTVDEYDAFYYEDKVVENQYAIDSLAEIAEKYL